MSVGVGCIHPSGLAVVPRWSFCIFHFSGSNAPARNLLRLVPVIFLVLLPLNESTATTWHLLSRPRPVSHVLYVLCPLSDTCLCIAKNSGVQAAQ